MIVALGVHQRYGNALEKTKRDVSQLTIVFARVLHGNQRPLEDRWGITKVDAMFGEIGLSLGFISHERRFIVATLCRYVKGAAGAARASLILFSTPALLTLSGVFLFLPFLPGGM